MVASNAFTHEDFRRSMTFLADGRVRTQPLHSRTVGLSDLPSALQDLASAATDDIKVLVRPDQFASGQAKGRRH
jgi:(R,R)-butanediol dehydrogenase/meso-butanediol dehydrogenase/diacetyl reductase